MAKNAIRIPQLTELKAAAVEISQHSSEMGVNLLANHYIGKSLVVCLVEMIKNAFDASIGRDGNRPLNVFIETYHDHIVIADGGWGMGAERRQSFRSFDKSPAKFSRLQHAKYGTGSKFLAFSFSRGKKIRVMTRCVEDPDFVYIFEFEPDDLIASVLGGAMIDELKVPFSKEIWPYEDDLEFGTIFEYYFADPKRGNIYRGDNLAAMLAARLDPSWQRKIRVDSKFLPAKNFKLDCFDETSVHPALGPVRVCLYMIDEKDKKDKRRATGENLLVGGKRVAENPLHALLNNLSDSTKARIPEIVLDPAVYGVITADFFDAYSSESRDQASTDIVEKEDLLVALFGHIDSLQARAAAHIGYELKGNGSQSDVSEQVANATREVCKTINSHFNPDGELPEGIDDVPEGPTRPRGPGKGDTGRNPSNSSYSLSLRRNGEMFDELELGDEFTLEAKSSSLSASELQFNTVASKAIVKEQKGLLLRLAAKTEGVGEITVEDISTGHTKSARYQIVAKREPRLNKDTEKVEAGSKFSVKLLNSDRAAMPLSFECSGDISLVEDSGNTSFEQWFLAPSFACQGKVAATDADGKRYECTVTVLPRREPKTPEMMKLGDTFFVLTLDDFYGSTRLVEFTGPKRVGGVEVEGITINLRSPLYEKYAGSESYSRELLRAICSGYSAWEKFDFDGGIDLETVLPTELRTIHAEIDSKAQQLFAEIG